MPEEKPARIVYNPEADKRPRRVVYDPHAEKRGAAAKRGGRWTRLVEPAGCSERDCTTSMVEGTRCYRLHDGRVFCEPCGEQAQSSASETPAERKPSKTKRTRVERTT